MEITTSGELRAWDALAARDPGEVCAAAGVLLDPGGAGYRVTCFGRPFLADPSGRTVTPADAGGAPLLARLDGHLQLVVPWYLALARGVRPCGRLLRPSSLPGGDIFVRGTHVLPLPDLARRHGRDAAAFLAAGARAGAAPVRLGDAAVELRPLPLVPVTVLLWTADEEFPARADLLLDVAAPRQLPTDVLWSVALMALRALE